MKSIIHKMLLKITNLKSSHHSRLQAKVSLLIQVIIQATSKTPIQMQASNATTVITKAMSYLSAEKNCGQNQTIKILRITIKITRITIMATASNTTPIRTRAMVTTKITLDVVFAILKVIP